MADHLAAAPWWRDALERIVWTFVQAFVGALLADAAGVLNLDAVKAAGIAGLAAVLAVVKTVAASRIGRPDAALPSTGVTL